MCVRVCEHACMCACVYMMSLETVKIEFHLHTHTDTPEEGTSSLNTQVSDRLLRGANIVHYAQARCSLDFQNTLTLPRAPHILFLVSHVPIPVL